MEQKKKVSAILYDRISERVLALAAELKRTPNELVNSFVEECLWQIDDKQIPRTPIETVKLARQMERRNLTLGDRLVQETVKSLFPGLDETQEEYRQYVLQLANLYQGPLTSEVMKKIKDQAAKMVREDAREQRRRLKSREQQSKATSNRKDVLPAGPK